MTDRVAVIGGGLAGLAAAATLRQRGFEVELYESRRRLGGRAGSFHHAATDQWVDNCQHVGMGCCTNLLDFCRRAGVSDCFSRQRRLTFLGPDGRPRNFSATRLLPAPLHLLPGLMRLKYLTLRQRLSVIATIGRLARLELDSDDVASDTTDRTVEQWLRENGQSDVALERFWSVVLVSALSETLDRASLAAARKVFVDGFLASGRAHELIVPRLPLAEIFDSRVGGWLGASGVHIHTGSRIERIDADDRRVKSILLVGGTRREFDYVVAAVPWWQVRSILAPPLLAAMPELAEVERIDRAPITAVHLWFDRPLTPLPNAVVVGRLSQWVFNHGRENGASSPARYQVVISASHEAARQDPDDLVAQVRRELEELWPVAREAKLIHRRVVTEPAAVFSLRPGVERLRPKQRTAVPNLALAGDWTATGWPATMEGAVRSGYLAAEAVLQAAGRPERLLVEDLPQNWLARRIITP